MLNVTEALEILKKEQITSSVQVFRRWLRAGKVPGAYQNTLKEGWQIPEEGLQDFIVTQSNEKYKASYDRGYADAMQVIDERDKELLWRGIYEHYCSVKRSEVRERIKSHFRDSKPFLVMSDRLFFQQDRKTPKSSIDIDMLGSFFRMNGTIYRLDQLGNEGYSMDTRLVDFMMNIVGEAVAIERDELLETYKTMQSDYHWDDDAVKQITTSDNKTGAKIIWKVSKTRTLTDASHLYRKLVALKEQMELMSIWK
ncbi:hypothetical protein [Listeria newyorkensis]|uniref:hypothetical protein n=1 Tax=Listeria newyorkensis TaxID=1497681 RepID=UPI00051D3F37|nr:hypothetical protein [Listeria newyorkensis]KGL43582.1 hypothetical protein EP58_07530 [Listeria newyorkensis]